MGINSKEIARRIGQRIAGPDLKNEFGTAWQNRILQVILRVEIVLGFFAYLPSVLHGLAVGLYSIIILDTIVYGTVLYLYFTKNLSANVKALGSISAIYVLAVALLIILGKDGPGFTWFILVPFLSSFLYGRKGAITSNLILALTFILLSFEVKYHTSSLANYDNYEMDSYILSAINLLVIGSIISFVIAETIRGIERSLDIEKNLTRELTETNELLANSNDKIALEKEHAEEADRLKSAFLANMSHEIRTPLNAILGFSELLSDPNFPKEQQKDFTEIIRSSGDQLLHIVEDILDISKIESNQIILFHKPVSLALLFNELNSISQNILSHSKKDIEIRLELPDSVKEISVYTDEIRLKQIFQNLVSNAIKYTREGFVELGCELIEKKNLIQFYVKDTGIGIPLNEKDLVFERFFQSKNIQMNAGTGLGLSISKGLVNLLGGKIWVESELDKGSTFFFTIPNYQNQVPPEKKIRAFRLADYSGKHIYIAEDNEFSFELLHEILQPSKATILHARNGKELLALIEKQKPDMVLLDIRMPEMDGEEAIQEIRKLHPDITVIAQTAYALSEQQARYIEMGCDAVIAKPIQRHKLFEVIDSFLGK